MATRISLIIFLLSVFVYSFGQMGNAGRYSGENDTDFIRDPGFGYMKNLDSLLRITNREADSLAHLNPKDIMVQKSNRDSFLLRLLNSPVTRILFWIVLIVFAWVILYKLFRFRPFARTKRDDDLIVGEEGEQLRVTSWYQQEIRKAEMDNDFMLATRYRFMEVLAMLNDENIIEFLPEKTNASYSEEIKDPDLRRVFLQLSQIYEWVWYGKQRISVSQYASVKSIFEQINVYA